MLQTGNQGILDGISLWLKLLTLGGLALSSWVGYKINTALHKEGGIMDRLQEQSEEIARIKENKDDHDRRIRDLEQWRFRKRD